MDFETYKNLGFSMLSDNDDFKKVVKNAELLIEAITKDFYVIHSLEDDLKSDVKFNSYRAEQYQKAICYQADLMTESGALDFFQQKASNLKSVSIGRTSLSSDTNPIDSATYGNSGVFLPVMSLLARTGLLYRGVNSH